MRVQRLQGALGAEVSEIDLSALLDDATVAVLRRAWLEHLVLFFRDQVLAPDRLLAFGARFGRVIEYPFLKGLDVYPLVVPVVKLPHETINFGGIWHSDTTYQDEPPSATLLIAREVPPTGGDTLFANQYAAYEGLPADVRREIDGLTWISSSAKADTTRSREDRVRDSGKAGADIELLAEHPVVRTHPETGRRALFVNPAHAVRFGDRSEGESKALLDFLHAHQVKPEFVTRFQWRVGSLAMWDNRCTLHNPVNDYHGHSRVMHRITLAGDRPR